ncbi:MAG: hypothetical protein V3T83_17080 [Acidobacteriota bacterium]
MKTIQVSDQAPSLQELLAIAREESVILELSDGEAFLLAEIDDFEREVERTRQNEDLLDKRSQQSETFTLEEVKEQLGLG